MSSRKTARQQLSEERARREEAERRRERLLRIAVPVAVALVIVAVAGIVQWQRSRIDTEAAYPEGVAVGSASGTGGQESAGLGSGIGEGNADAPVVIEVFEDFLCSHCGEFETASDPTLAEYAGGNEARLVYYPMTLGPFGRPTELAANAYACAAEGGKAREMHEALFANFGQEWTNDKLVNLGASAGLTSGAFRSCVRDDHFAEWVKSIDQTATDRGVEGTPTIFVDGKPLEDPSPAGLKQAVEAVSPEQ